MKADRLDELVRQVLEDVPKPEALEYVEHRVNVRENLEDPGYRIEHVFLFELHIGTRVATSIEQPAAREALKHQLAKAYEMAAASYETFTASINGPKEPAP